MNCMEQLQAEMNPDVNPLVPGGKAAKQAEREAIASDPTHEGALRREMSPDLNPLIVSDEIGYPTIPPNAGGNWVWRESRQLWFRTR